MLSPIRLGVDLGREHDYSAFAAVEPIGDHFEVRTLYRIKLGTPFTEVAEKLVHAVTKLREKGDVMVVLDASGVGPPVVEMLLQPLKELCVFKPVEFIHGDEMRPVMKSTGDRYWRVGKAYLISRLKALMQNGKIISAPTNHFRNLQAELLAFEVKALGGYDFYGAKSGRHDDLVVALALACLDEIPSDPAILYELNRAMNVANDYEAINMELGSVRMGGNINGWRF